jgi:hypothetical protein
MFFRQMLCHSGPYLDILFFPDVKDWKMQLLERCMGSIAPH